MDEPGSRRGRAHNAEGARQTILVAAETVFAQNGFDGARIDAIASLSGYNKSLIFQYFGDKLNLYAAVVRRADDQTRGMQNQALAEFLQEDAISDPNRLRLLLRKFLEYYFDYMVEHPNFLRILNWEMAEGWQTYAKILTERDFQDITDFTPPLQKIMELGELRSDYDPIAQIVTAIFTSQLYLSCVPFLRMMTPGLDAQSPQEIARARDFIIGFITHGLIVDSDEAHQKEAPPG